MQQAHSHMMEICFSYSRCASQGNSDTVEGYLHGDMTFLTKDVCVTRHIHIHLSYKAYSHKPDIYIHISYIIRVCYISLHMAFLPGCALQAYPHRMDI